LSVNDKKAVDNGLVYDFHEILRAFFLLKLSEKNISILDKKKKFKENLK